MEWALALEAGIGEIDVPHQLTNYFPSLQIYTNSLTSFEISTLRQRVF